MGCRTGGVIAICLTEQDMQVRGLLTQAILLAWLHPEALFSGNVDRGGSVSIDVRVAASGVGEAGLEQVVVS